MTTKIKVNFKNIVSEMETKGLKLFFFKNGHFVEDAQGNVYAIEIYHHGSYLDKLITDGNTIQFNRIDSSVFHAAKDHEKKVWEASEVAAFIERHSLHLCS